jgi:hypothetical protein
MLERNVARSYRHARHHSRTHRFLYRPGFTNSVARGFLRVCAFFFAFFCMWELADRIYFAG